MIDDQNFYFIRVDIYVLWDELSGGDVFEALLKVSTAE